MNVEMRQVKRAYLQPLTLKATVTLEDGMCKTSYVVKDNEASKGDMTIERQEAVGDGYDFTFDPYEY